MQKTEMLTLWLTEDDKNKVRAIAEKNSMSMSDVARILISNGIKNVEDGSPLRLM